MIGRVLKTKAAVRKALAPHAGASMVGLIMSADNRVEAFEKWAVEFEMADLFRPAVVGGYRKIFLFHRHKARKACPFKAISEEAIRCGNALGITVVIV